MNTYDIIGAWMLNCCKTINEYDHKAHMNLISKTVKVYGIEGYDVIGYDDWYAQCEHEFSQKIIKEASYDGLHIKKVDDNRIYFSTVEIIDATDGSSTKHGIDIVLSKEQDGEWRVTEERLLDIVDARKEGLPV